MTLRGLTSGSRRSPRGSARAAQACGVALAALLLAGLAPVSGVPGIVTVGAATLLLAGLVLAMVAGRSSRAHTTEPATEAGAEIDRERRILDAAPVPIVIHRDGRVLYANAAAVHLAGAPDRESVRNLPLLELVHPDDRAAVLARMREVQDGREVELREFRVLGADGSIRHVESKGIPIEFEGRRAVLTIARDVTGERRALEAMDTSERRYRQIFEQGVAGVYRITLDGQILEANDAFARTLGFSSGEALRGSDFFDFFRAPGERRKRISELKAGGAFANREIELRRVDGRAVWLLENSALMKDPDSGDQVIVGTTVDITDRKRAEMALRDSEQRYRRLFHDSHDAIYMTGVDGSLVTMNPAGLALLGYVEEDLHGMRAQDMYVDPQRRDEFRRSIDESGFVEDFEVPLRRKDGEILDCLLTATVRRDPEGTIVGYQGIIRDVTERKKFEQQLERRALHDPLTDLPNRALFWDRLEHAMTRASRKKETLAVLFIDLDRFKVVNDSLGHMVGDRVLVSVARRLLGCVRAQDTVARFGGDEFTVLLEGMGDVDETIEAADRIVQTFGAPFLMEDQEVYLRASIGVSIFTGGKSGQQERPLRPDDLVRRSDMAMYRAKGRAGTRYRIFDPELDVEERGRLQEENDLRRAIERGEFVLHYQPIVELGTGRIVGVEPLIRWVHPDRGVVAPDDFIPLAEETGFILPLGEWVIETACRELHGWSAIWDREHPLFVHPNISARQFEDPKLPGAIERILAQTGVEPRQVQLEVTEHMVMLVPERLRELKRLGVGVVVDDFGTGYSSLGYIRQLQVDGLKIDRSFIQGLANETPDEAIVTTIITLGRHLKIDVVAEGIESRAQLERLRALDCGFGQGHYFAPPIPAADLTELLKKNPRW